MVEKNIRLEVMQFLEKDINQFVSDYLIPVEEIWQPSDLLPNSEKETFFDEVKELREIAKDLPYDFWVVLVGDTAQHAPVARGDAMRLLETYSGIPVAAIRQIRRQEQMGYREAVKALSDGDTATGFAILESIGAVVEVENDAVRYRQLAEEFFRCLDDTGQAPLVVSPTHAEGRAVTKAIREMLAERWKLGPEKPFLQYRDLKWVEADKLRVENYSVGLMLQFHQNANFLVFTA